MIAENNYCSDVMKKYFNKELVMTKKDNEDFKNFNKSWIYDNDCTDKVRDHWYITGKYWLSAHRDCNINVNLNHKTPIFFQNLEIMIHILLCKNYKVNPKINVVF